MKEAIFHHESVLVEDHPAVKAWAEVGGAKPASVAVLQRRSGKPLNHKSTVYRLEGVFPGSQAIIAKRSRRSSLLAERFVHEEVLPALPLSRLRYHGFVEDQESDLAWLFLEEAAGVRYNEGNPAHRVAASNWLGTLHAVTAGMDLAGRLPRLESSQYRTTLGQLRVLIVQHLEGRSFDPAQRRLLSRILAHCDQIDEQWEKLESLWQTMPASLVHGDFIAKNVRVSVDPAPISLFVMDWEYAAWGVAAEDVAGLDMEIYGFRWREARADLDPSRLRALELSGRILRAMAWIRVTALELSSDWAESLFPNLELYESTLAAACGAFAWE